MHSGDGTMTFKEFEEKAKTAETKPASFGEDIDLEAYLDVADELPYQGDPSQLPEQTILEKLY